MIVDAVQRARGQRIRTLRACQVAGDVQALGALRQQQFDFVQPQRLRAMAVRVGELGDAFLQQRAALAQAEHFIAQHAVGRRGVQQALGLGALVAAQRFCACFQCIEPQ